MQRKTSAAVQVLLMPLSNLHEMMEQKATHSYHASWVLVTSVEVFLFLLQGARKTELQLSWMLFF